LIQKGKHIRKVTGELINFRGLVWAPINEQGVVLLFGMIARELGFYVELVQSGYPDCLAKRCIGHDRWEEVRIEFEFCSSRFKHNPAECDMIVCWEHDWRGCPPSIKVIELRREIRQLKNRTQFTSPRSPRRGNGQHSIATHLARSSPHIVRQYERLDRCICGISGVIYSRPTKYRLVYCSPQRVFTAIAFRRKFLNIHLFTNGQRIPGVEPFAGKNGAKWGRIYLRGPRDVQRVASAVMSAHQRISRCIEKKIPTGWFAPAS